MDILIEGERNNGHLKAARINRNIRGHFDILLPSLLGLVSIDLCYCGSKYKYTIGVLSGYSGEKKRLCAVSRS